MKIAVPLNEKGNIDEHFGHCSSYAIYTIDENSNIIEKQIILSEQGCGCKSNIAETLAQLGVSKMLAGGIGNGAVNVLSRQRINVVRGCSGNAETVVNEYLAGKIKDSGNNCAHHHHHN